MQRLTYVKRHEDVIFIAEGKAIKMTSSCTLAYVLSTSLSITERRDRTSHAYWSRCDFACALASLSDQCAHACKVRKWRPKQWTACSQAVLWTALSTRVKMALSLSHFYVFCKVLGQLYESWKQSKRKAGHFNKSFGICKVINIAYSVCPCHHYTESLSTLW